MSSITYKVRPEDDGMRLDAFLLKRCPEVPRSFLQRMIRKGECRIGDRRAAASRRVRAGDPVVLREAPVNVGLPAPDPRVTFGVLFEDDHVIGIDKPAGLVVHPGPGHRRRTLVNGLMARYGAQLARLGKQASCGLVHRLDADTSGAMVVARTRDAYEHLSQQFRAQQVGKIYRTLVSGTPKRSEGVIDIPLGKMSGARTRIMVGRGFDLKQALTRYRVLERLGRFTLLEVRPETGRTHQIRAHLAHEGAPVVGDPDYGDAEANAEARRVADLRRMFLHCHRLTLRHPASGELLVLTSELPVELVGALSALKRGN